MNTTEIFEKLHALRTKIENDTEEPMLSSDNALLYDVAQALGLTDDQAHELAGDNEPETAPAETESPHDFSSSGLGIGGAGQHDLAAEMGELIARGEMVLTDHPTGKLCDCGHYSQSPMTASLGSACPDCYDEMSD